MNKTKTGVGLGACEACQWEAKSGTPVARSLTCSLTCARCTGTGKERIVQIQAAADRCGVFALTSNGRIFQQVGVYNTCPEWIEVPLP